MFQLRNLLEPACGAYIIPAPLVFALFAHRRFLIPAKKVHEQSDFSVQTYRINIMSRIEELPDDFDESLNLNEAPPQVAQDLPQPGFDAFAATNEAPFPINEERLKELINDPNAPGMPPAMASVKSHSKEELLDMMNKTPLFMTDIENAGDESMLNLLLISDSCRLRMKF